MLRVRRDVLNKTDELLKEASEAEGASQKDLEKY
jgi:hypothetical protein